jgi:CBS domain-containing protein
VVPLKGRTLADAASELVNALIVSGAAPHPDRLEELLAAESLPKDVVPVGPEAFMLHFRTDAVDRATVALGVSPEPVSRERDSTRGARIIILIVAPPGDRGAAEFLQVQGGFAHALAQPEIVEGMLAARKPDDVLAVSALSGIILPGNLAVRDVMAAPVLFLRSDATLGEAARLMTGSDVSAVPVVNEAREVVGMMRYRELLTHLLPGYVKRISGEASARGRKPGRPTPPDPSGLTVKQVMDRSVLCVSEDQSLADVATIMVNKDVDRLPVVREGVLVGFITEGDIVRKLLVGGPLSAAGS